VLVVAHDITKILMEIKNQRCSFDDLALGRRKSGNFIFTVILQLNGPRGVAPHWLQPTARPKGSEPLILQSGVSPHGESQLNKETFFMKNPLYVDTGWYGNQCFQKVSGRSAPPPASKQAAALTPVKS
jgi:hypothetical protein